MEFVLLEGIRSVEENNAPISIFWEPDGDFITVR
jgi:hypothetical protein